MLMKNKNKSPVAVYAEKKQLGKINSTSHLRILHTV